MVMNREDMQYQGVETPARQHDGEHSPQSRTCFKFAGLVESADPFAASSLARENVYNWVTEEGPDFLLSLLISTSGVWGEVLGPPSKQTISNVRSGFRAIADVTEVAKWPFTPNPLVEVKPHRVEYHDDLFADLELAANQPDQPFRKLVMGPDAVPNGNLDTMREFMQCIQDIPGAAIWTLMAASSDLGELMAESYWRSSFIGGSNVGWQMWRGTKMICVRSFLCSSIGEIPSRMRAERKIMSQRIEFTPLSDADQEELRHPSANTLKGFDVPYGVYRSLVPLPSAGIGQRIPGIPTIRQPAVVVPLDPAPRRAEGSLRLGEAVAADGVLFEIGQKPTDKQRHIQITGQPGSGKTTLLTNDCVQYAIGGIGYCYLDPHGDGTRRVMIDLPPTCRTRQWFVDHSDPTHIIPISPLYATDEESFARAIAATNDALREYIDPKREGMWGERATRIFTLIGTACWHLGTVSLPMIAAIVASQDLCRDLANRVDKVKPAIARQIMEELGNLRSSDSRDLFSWMGSRLGQMLNSPGLIRILGTGANAIDMAQIMDRGEGLLVDLGASHLGPDAVRVLEMCYLILMDLAKSRRQDRTRPFIAVVDEAHTVQIGPLASLLDEGRKYGIGIEVAHQRLGQLMPQIADALEADTASFICLRTGVKDAARAAIRLRDWPVSDLSRLPVFQAAATICSDGVPTEPFTLFIDPPKTYEGEDLAARQDQSRRITEETILTLSTPYADLEPVTPDNVQDVLARPADPGRHARLAARQVAPVTADGLLTRMASDMMGLMGAKEAEALVSTHLGGQLVETTNTPAQDTLPDVPPDVPPTPPATPAVDRFLARWANQPTIPPPPPPHRV